MNTELRSHVRRMMNSNNADRIAAFAKAHSISDLQNIPPIFATVDLTWNCNYECKGCIDTKARDNSDVVYKKAFINPTTYDKSSFKGRFLDKSIMLKIIQYAKINHLRGLQLMGGETLLHPDIDSIFSNINDNNIPIELVSNGSFLLEHVNSLCKVLRVPDSWLRISINAWSKYGERVGWPDELIALRNKVFDGLKNLLSKLPDSYKSNVYVSTVAFADVLNDLRNLVTVLSGIGLRNMTIIRERDPEKKTFIKGQDIIRDKVTDIVNSIRKTKNGKNLNIYIADNILVEPKPQKKEYLICPSVFLKAMLGADGNFYACTDHRGSEVARLVNIHNYGDEFGKAWHSSKRVKKALAWQPNKHCSSIVCQRFEGNVAIDMFRTKHPSWTF